MNERLESLITRWSDGSLREEEARELEALLLGDSEARARFRRHANLDAGLREWAEARVVSEAWPAQPRTNGISNRHAGRWVMAVAAAVALMAGGTVWWWQWQRGASSHNAEVADAEGSKNKSTSKSKNRNETAAAESSEAIGAHEATAQGCAVISQMLDARFAGQPAFAKGATVPPGRIHLTHGYAQIEFFSGATLLAEGDAELELVSAWEARCFSGKVRVRVPPAAHGFRLHAPGVKLVDLGTEFALNADAAAKTADVHVFAGEVVAHPAGSATQIALREGQGFRGAQPAALDPKQFLGIGQLQELVLQRQEERFRAWQTWWAEARRDERLIAYYPMRHFAQWERLVQNTAEPGDKLRNGGAVGAAWTHGRWPQKDALHFKQPGDRVRLQIPGSYTALTLACWARVDALEHRYNALLLTDGYDPGAPHWQIYEDGRLMFSLAYLPTGQADPKKKQNQIYFSPPVITPESMGQWHHLAVAYDNQTGEVVQYFDGHPISREVSKFHVAGRPMQFGPCELGNWGLPTEGHKFPIRNLDGCLDEFAIYSARLSDAEIERLYANGKPE